MKQPLERSVRASNRLLTRLLKNFPLLESDLILLQEEAYKIHYCIDFYDLRSYLSLTESDLDRPQGANRPEGVLDEYVRVLLLSQFTEPLVFLPMYFEEFREHVGSEFGSKRDSVRESNRWVAELIEVIRRAMGEVDSLFQYLRDTVELDKEADFSEVDRRAGELIESLRKIIGRMSRGTRAGGFLRRFDALVEEKRLIGLEEALGSGEGIRVDRGQVYLVASDYLNGRRPRKTRANKTDALALSTINRVNERTAGRRELFYLVSGAQLLQNAVVEVNRTVLRNKQFPIELRDLDYWKLWFASAQEGVRPTLKRVQEFRARVWEELEALASRSEFLVSRLQLAMGSGDGGLMKDIEDEAETFRRRLEGFLEGLVEPVFGAGWSLSMVGDILLPFREEEEQIGTILRNIEASLVELYERRGEVEEVERILQVLLKELEKIIWYLEGEAAPAEENLELSGESFYGGWEIGRMEWREPYRSLLEELEERGPSAVGKVFKTLAASEEQGRHRNEKYVVAARAHLYEGAWEAAAEELDWVGEDFREDATYRLTAALVAKCEGRLEKAAKLLRELWDEEGNPMIGLEWVGVERRRHVRGEIHGRLEQLIKVAREVRERLSSEEASFVLRSTATILYYDLLADSDSGSIDSVVLDRGLEELRELRRQAMHESHGEVQIREIKRLSRRLRRLK